MFHELHYHVYMPCQIKAEVEMMPAHIRFAGVCGSSAAGKQKHWTVVKMLAATEPLVYRRITGEWRTRQECEC